jgi:hypothetical protein
MYAYCCGYPRNIFQRPTRNSVFVAYYCLYYHVECTTPQHNTMISERYPTVTKHRNKFHNTTKLLLNQKRDVSVARMSNADRLRSGLGLPMNDILVVTWPVGQRAPATAPQPSLALRG